MIPWSLRDWSTNDVLRALGYTHTCNPDTFGADRNHIKARGRVVYRAGSVFEVNEWLRRTGQVDAWMGAS